MADPLAAGTAEAGPSAAQHDVDMSHGDDSTPEPAPAAASPSAAALGLPAPLRPPDAEPIPPPSPPWPRHLYQPPTAVDSLAHKLSEQHLRRARSASASPPPPRPRPGRARLPDDVPELQPCPELEMELQPSGGYPCAFPTSSASSSSSLGAFPPDDVPIQPLALARRPRPIDTQLPQLPSPPSGGRPGGLERLVDNMISTGQQCRVFRPPPPPQRPRTPPAHLEVDPRFLGDLPDLEIDPDEALEPPWVSEMLPSLRRAGDRGAIRKTGLLPFPLSADVALRCGNAVLSKPRMRRRKKTGRQHSTTSRGTSHVSASPAPSSPGCPPMRPPSMALPPPSMALPPPLPPLASLPPA